MYYLSRPGEVNIYSKKKKLPHLPAVKRSSSSQSEESSESEVNANFRLWWKRGRIILLCILLSTIAAAIALMLVVNVYY